MATQSVSGLNTTPATSYQSVSNPTISQPTYPVASISSWKMSYQDNRRSLYVSWTIATTRSPQFSYIIQMYNASTTNLVKTIQDSGAHVRSLVIDVGSMAAGNYNVN